MGGEPCEPLADDLAYSLRSPEPRERPREPDACGRELERAGLDQRAPELGHQEGVAVRQLGDRAGDPRKLGAGLAARRVAHEVRDLVARKPVEPQSDDTFRSAKICERLRERLRNLCLGVPERGEQQHARLRGRPREMPEEQERGGVGPVAVLQHEQQRPVTADAGQQVGDRGVKAMPLGVRICGDRRRQLADAKPEVGEEPHELPAGRAEPVAQLRGIRAAGQVVEALGERAVGRGHDGVAGAVEDERALLRRHVRELAHEPALAGARLPRRREPRAARRPRPAARGLAAS